MRVRVNSIYTYRPVVLDQINPPHGVQAGLLKPGDQVRVVNLPGCPKAGTMGHCHIQSVDGKEFLGLVVCNSLQPNPRSARRRERDQVLRDLGLTKVRGALGGTYWE
ncbi:MAG: hypothetical protein ABSB42_07950 [Tepidisphaeraceae bacterium]|jgi:hypothetical protein